MDTSLPQKFTILHTTTATVDSLKALAAEILPGWVVVNFVDDSILPQLADNGGDMAEVAERLCAYARFAEQIGSRAILSACSSVGELVPQLQRQVSIPVVRIDEAMAEEAIRRGARLGVAATLATTLGPTVRLLERKAAEAGTAVQLQARLVDGAYQRLMTGDRAGHDDLLAAALTELARSVEAVVLAQASMARVVSTLPESEQARFLSSPRLGMQRLRQVLESSSA